MPGDTEGVHRLSDILVEEVSLVDRPANKRRFLLVKREGDMSELRSNGRGGFTRVSKADGDDEETEKAGKKPPFGGAKAPPFGKKPEDAEKAKGDDEEEDDEDETEKGASMTDNMEGADKKKKAVFENDEEKRKKSAGGQPPAAQILGELTKAIELAVKAAEDMKDHEESEGDLPEKAVKSLASAHAKMASCVSMCAKRAPGAASFAKAVDSLASVMSTIMEGKGGRSGHDADAGDPQKPAAGFSAKNPSGVMSGTPGTMKSMLAAVEELTGIVKSQAKTIRKMKGEPAGGSNSIVVEKAAGGPRRTDGVAWPMDMNDDRFDKSKVDKSISFFDD